MLNNTNNDKKLNKYINNVNINRKVTCKKFQLELLFYKTIKDRNRVNNSYK